ncbi:enoyl-CoA hydratase/isomerase family protein [Streptomyces sp. NBC_01617]|uniref:enoyl-CoA hydratase/isomerase family protein n=2 Tax=Streptomyces TaxID=1883 RepID=UPI0038652B96
MSEQQGPYGRITHVVDGHVATVTLNRPEARNGCTRHMADELAAAFLLADNAPGVHAVLLTGAGEDFCVSADTVPASVLGQERQLDRRVHRTRCAEHASVSSNGSSPRPVRHAYNSSWKHDASANASLTAAPGSRLTLTVFVSVTCTLVGARDQTKATSAPDEHPADPPRSKRISEPAQRPPTCR